MSEDVQDRPGPAASLPGPTVSYAFNLGKVPDHGEDSDPILRDGPDLGLLAVFDGMGGAGGTVYETDDGPRSGAYLASRIARDVVEQRMLRLLVPDWNLKGSAAAEDLRRSVEEALQERLAELRAPKSALRSRLLRALPTTMAVVALQRGHRGSSRWLAHVFWAGDSRAYVFQPDGVRQLTTDDLREPSDAMDNLRRDSVVSNAMSADTAFHVSYRRVELEGPFVLACATDGCFGYLPTPMHFEHLVLAPLTTTRTVEAWSEAVQSAIAAVTGDDASMAVMAVGAELRELRDLFGARVETLEQEFTAPVDALAEAVRQAEHELEVLRQRQVDDTQRLWAQYRPAYERYLHAPEPEPEPEAEVEARPAGVVEESDVEVGEPVVPGEDEEARS